MNLYTFIVSYSNPVKEGTLFYFYKLLIHVPFQLNYWELGIFSYQFIYVIPFVKKNIEGFYDEEPEKHQRVIK